MMNALYSSSMLKLKAEKGLYLIWKVLEQVFLSRTTTRIRQCTHKRMLSGSEKVIHLLNPIVFEEKKNI